jgi:hypothetical protein
LLTFSTKDTYLKGRAILKKIIFQSNLMLQNLSGFSWEVFAYNISEFIYEKIDIDEMTF